jgi:pyridoxamine 5'-phosphate oxidase
MPKKVKNSVVQNLRREYESEPLDLSSVLQDPIDQFDHWFKEALQSDILEPNAMTLATATRDGLPSARIVLLKGYLSTGFSFYTNFDSRKGKEIEDNAAVALVFNWLELHRQVRIEGHARKLNEEEATAYFQSRPVGSQIGAWASAQSTIIPNRSVLEQEVDKLQQQYKDAAHLPKPPFWGGYLVEPHYLEFWQGRPNRLHDRIAYEKVEDDKWILQRLSP